MATHVARVRQLNDKKKPDHGARSETDRAAVIAITV
jgi:hypothetical protein